MTPLPRSLLLLLVTLAPAPAAAGDLGDRTFEVRGPPPSRSGPWSRRR